MENVNNYYKKQIQPNSVFTRHYLLSTKTGKNLIAQVL